MASPPYNFFLIIFNALLCKMTPKVQILNSDRQAKLTDLSQFFCKKKINKIENCMNGGMVRESPHYDFLIIFNAILCKMTRRIRINFDHQAKLTELSQFIEKN